MFPISSGHYQGHKARMLNLSDVLFIVYFLVQFMSAICGLEGYCALQLNASVEYICTSRKCFLELPTPKAKHVHGYIHADKRCQWLFVDQWNICSPSSNTWR